MELSGPCTLFAAEMRKPQKQRYKESESPYSSNTATASHNGRSGTPSKVGANGLFFSSVFLWLYRAMAAAADPITFDSVMPTGFCSLPPPAPTAISQWCQQSNGRRPVRGGDWCVARSSLRRLPGGGDRPCAGVGTVPQHRLVLPFGRERLRSLRISNMAVAWGVLHHNVVAPQSPGFGPPAARRGAEPWGCEWRRECTLKGCDKTDVAPSVTGHIAHLCSQRLGLWLHLEIHVTKGGC